MQSLTKPHACQLPFRRISTERGSLQIPLRPPEAIHLMQSRRVIRISVAGHCTIQFDCHSSIPLRVFAYRVDSISIVAGYVNPLTHIMLVLPTYNKLNGWLAAGTLHAQCRPPPYHMIVALPVSAAAMAAAAVVAWAYNITLTPCRACMMRANLALPGSTSVPVWPGRRRA